MSQLLDPAAGRDYFTHRQLPDNVCIDLSAYVEAPDTPAHPRKRAGLPGPQARSGPSRHTTRTRRDEPDVDTSAHARACAYCTDAASLGPPSGGIVAFGAQSFGTGLKPAG